MMTDFIVSARKYRPTTFDSVVGQLPITSTLKNSIKSNQLAQSFLFCGPRGVGKTTCARIFAKEINSFTNDNDDFSYNIFELDAASNNSVDDIRNLTDQVRFPPQLGKYKVYIIDEVHMLSQSAFNAFLKTLEEPPSHAKFILATTEKHKIIPTILSRCQIFDFKRVCVDDIAKHLEFIAESENINAEKEALYLIAQKADGAVRDALSIFDRLVSFSDKLSYKSVISQLNILDYDYYFKITNFLLDNDINGLLNTYNEILENGFDSHHFINGLANHLRDLLVSNDENTISLLEKSDILEARYLEQSKKCELDFLLSALKLINECDVQYKTTNNQRLLVELTLMRISSTGLSNDEKKNSKSFVVNTNKKTYEFSGKRFLEKDKNTQKNSLDFDKRENVIIDSLTKKKSSLISINSSFDEANEAHKEDTSQVILKEISFTEDQLLEQWKGLISAIRKKGKSNLGIALSLHSPKLMEGNLIELPLSNAAQEEMILEQRYMILDYLRRKLENDKIEITTKIVNIEKNRTPYTNKEKFEKMLDDNPELEILRINLGLDPDY